MKNRKQKQKEYEEKYSMIPNDYGERLAWMDDKYKLTDGLRDQIMDRAFNIINNLEFYDFLIVLYMVPEGTPRHRYRLITPKNYMTAAVSSPYVHVYQPRAAENSSYLHKLLDTEVVQLQQFIQTPFACNINTFFPTPSNYNRVDTFIAEMGLDFQITKVDVDNQMKCILDMFNENVWLDDRMCFSGRLNKFYSIKPRIEIQIKYANCAMNKYQYNRIVNSVNYREDEPITYLDKNGIMWRGDSV